MVKKWNLLPEKCGYLAKIWFIWFKPACTAQSANPSSKTWFKRPDEQYIHAKNNVDVICRIKNDNGNWILYFAQNANNTKVNAKTSIVDCCLA